MATANPTLMGGKDHGFKKGAYIKDAGDKYTFVRCDKCESKYVKEECDGECPECKGKLKKLTSKK